MTAVLGFSQGFAAALLAIAAVSKLVARVDLTPFLVVSGVPERLSRHVAPLVVPTEAVLAAALALGTVAVPATLVALALSLAFVALQVRSAMNADAEGCRCFGHLDSNERAFALLGATMLAAALLVAAAALAAEATPNGDIDRVFGVLSGAGAVIASALAGQIVRFRRQRLGVARA